MSLFQALRRSGTPSGSRSSTPPVDSVRAPFAHVGSAPQPAPGSQDDHEVDERARCNQFRILIIGRANAGKTTILQKVCGTTEKPTVYNDKGKKVLRYLIWASPNLTRHLRSIKETFLSLLATYVLFFCVLFKDLLAPLSAWLAQHQQRNGVQKQP